MKNAAPEKNRLTAILFMLAAALVCILGIMLLLLHEKPEDISGTVPPADIPAETAEPIPTEEPTEPPAELNPYGIFDFQYDGRYLKLLEGDSVTGIDVSAYQGQIDWEQVKASGVEFAMIRVGFRGYGEAGTIREDEYARANLEGAAAAGLDVGVYFFSQAVSVEEALEEAEFVLEILDGMELAMPVVYDWEYVNETARTANVDRRTLTDCSLAFLQRVEEAGYWPMLYFNTRQALYMLNLRELNQYDFWLALYSHRMTFPYKIKMWQYTCTGSVPGIEGNCDINIFFP